MFFFLFFVVVISQRTFQLPPTWLWHGNWHDKQSPVSFIFPDSFAAIELFSLHVLFIVFRCWKQTCEWFPPCDSAVHYLCILVSHPRAAGSWVKSSHFFFVCFFFLSLIAYVFKLSVPLHPSHPTYWLLCPITRPGFANVSEWLSWSQMPWDGVDVKVPFICRSFPLTDLQLPCRRCCQADGPVWGKHATYGLRICYDTVGSACVVLLWKLSGGSPRLMRRLA